LVLRGYISREVDPADGEVSLALTERGRAANEASFQGCHYVDQELERRLSDTEMAGLRRGLAVLGEIKQSLSGPVIRRGLPRQMADRPWHQGVPGYRNSCAKHATCIVTQYDARSVSLV
jgi:hypothetical protein